VTSVDVVLDAAVAHAALLLDDLIERHLAALERHIREALAATGPEDDAALDRPPNPDAPWQRITVEEILFATRARWETWRREVLTDIRSQIATAFEGTEIYVSVELQTGPPVSSAVCQTNYRAKPVTTTSIRCC
jgi:hypothetical protein